MKWGKREIIKLYILLHCHHQNDSCIKIGSEESPFKQPDAKSLPVLTNGGLLHTTRGENKQILFFV